MAQERTWNAVPPVQLTANGSTEGVLQVTDTAGFYFGMQATLNSNLQIPLTVYIKRVVNNTTLWVGASKGGLDHSIDLSAYTVTNHAYISAAEQNKSTVPEEGKELATYETDPVNARRVIPVDEYGNHYNDGNPLPVAFDGTVQIGDVSILDKNTQVPMKVNNDGSINVIVEPVPSPNNEVVSTYNEISSVPAAVTTQIVSYTVPVGHEAVFQKCPVSGDNIARYDLLINNVVQDTLRTMFGGDLTQVFDWTNGNDSGFTLNAGDKISVQVTHNRPYLGMFEARIQVLQINLT